MLIVPGVNVSSAEATAFRSATSEERTSSWEDQAASWVGNCRARMTASVNCDGLISSAPKLESPFASPGDKDPGIDGEAWLSACKGKTASNGRMSLSASQPSASTTGQNSLRSA